jgi:hypothetical protein
MELFDGDFAPSLAACTEMDKCQVCSFYHVYTFQLHVVTIYSLEIFYLVRRRTHIQKEGARMPGLTILRMRTPVDFFVSQAWHNMDLF